MNDLLLVAAQKGDLANVKNWLIKKADPNSKDPKHGMTALMLAAAKGHTDVARLLIAKGANVNATENTYGQTALMIAASGGHTEVAKLLIESGADVNAKEPKYGQTALRFAESKGHKAIVELLSKNQAAAQSEGTAAMEPVAVRSPEDQLIAAAKDGDTAKVKELIAKGVDVSAKDGEGLTAFTWAARGWHTEIVALLKKAQKDAEQPASTNKTVSAEKSAGTEKSAAAATPADSASANVEKLNETLLAAAAKGDADAVKDLIAKGAEATAKGKDGKTALKIATEKGYADVEEILKKAGAKE
ncbi:MAG: ankyrin repeat domain-containing protein [Verrucomicrobia bacterium]|nr:ankyrin repeat domain-containing protein [Verrucomicrobiota bacterium]